MLSNLRISFDFDSIPANISGTNLLACVLLTINRIATAPLVAITLALFCIKPSIAGKTPSAVRSKRLVKRTDIYANVIQASRTTCERKSLTVEINGKSSWRRLRKNSSY